MTVKTTCLAAHALPPEFAGKPDDYIDLVCNEILPAVARRRPGRRGRCLLRAHRLHRRADRAGVRQSEALGLPVKLHADQLSDMGGAALAARYNALSADHIEYSAPSRHRRDGQGRHRRRAAAGRVLFLREKQLPPIEPLRRHNVRIAISTDCNPGTSPALSLLLMMNMACTLFRMTPEETLAGVTETPPPRSAWATRTASCSAGYAADLAIWDIGRPAELSYWLGGNPSAGVVQAGRWRSRTF